MGKGDFEAIFYWGPVFRRQNLNNGHPIAPAMALQRPYGAIVFGGGLVSSRMGLCPHHKSGTVAAQQPPGRYGALSASREARGVAPGPSPSTTTSRSGGTRLLWG